MNSSVKAFFLFLFCAFAGTVHAEAVLETDTFRYVISDEGKNLSLFDKAGNREYLRKEPVSACAYVKAGGTEFPATGAALDGGTLRLEFGGASALLHHGQVTDAPPPEVGRWTNV